MLLFILYASPLFTKEKKKKNTFASRMLSYLATSEHVSCHGLQLHQHLIRSLEKRLKMSKLTLLWGGISHQIPKKQEKLSQFWLQNSRYDSSKKKKIYIWIVTSIPSKFFIFYFDRIPSNFWFNVLLNGQKQSISRSKPTPPREMHRKVTCKKCGPNIQKLRNTKTKD